MSKCSEVPMRLVEVGDQLVLLSTSGNATRLSAILPEDRDALLTALRFQDGTASLVSNCGRPVADKSASALEKYGIVAAATAVPPPGVPEAFPMRLTIEVGANAKIRSAVERLLSLRGLSPSGTRVPIRLQLRLTSDVDDLGIRRVPVIIGDAVSAIQATGFSLASSSVEFPASLPNERVTALAEIAPTNMVFVPCIRQRSGQTSQVDPDLTVIGWLAAQGFPLRVGYTHRFAGPAAAAIRELRRFADLAPLELQFDVLSLTEHDVPDIEAVLDDLWSVAEDMGTQLARSSPWGNMLATAALGSNKSQAAPHQGSLFITEGGRLALSWMHACNDLYISPETFARRQEVMSPAAAMGKRPNCAACPLDVLCSKYWTPELHLLSALGRPVAASWFAQLACGMRTQVITSALRFWSNDKGAVAIPAAAHYRNGLLVYENT